MKELRKVVFKLNNTELGYFDSTTEPERIAHEDELKEREGYLHKWGQRIITDIESGASLEETIAIVEDMNGIVYQLTPDLIVRFIAENEK